MCLDLSLSLCVVSVFLWICSAGGGGYAAQGVGGDGGGEMGGGAHM